LVFITSCGHQPHVFVEHYLTTPGGDQPLHPILFPAVNRGRGGVIELAQFHTRCPLRAEPCRGDPKFTFEGIKLAKVKFSRCVGYGVLRQCAIRRNAVAL
jgi:hypothetical protein